MKLTILGATGGIGSELVKQALAAGHEVTAAARRPDAIQITSGNLQVVKADVTDAASLAPAVKDADAVLSALAARRKDPAAKTFCATAMRNILQAMTEAGVSRVVATSAGPVPEVDPGMRGIAKYVAKPLLWAILGDHYRDLRVMEDLLRRSELDWTVVRPSRLLDKPVTGRYRLARDQSVPGSMSIPRADVAHAMLHCLDDPTTIKAAFGVST